ncbi:MAG: SGNH/GDSL hydrolase family protein [Candidatus Eremiobacteraeota bacterium]|nr:SGNH/GDSL hydrolase family protein [Candidatus Eremiobacteraeota bacterium]
MIGLALAAAVILSSPSPDPGSANTPKHVFAFLGDSIMCSYFSPPGYPALVKKELGLTIHNLATIDPPGPGYYIWQAKPVLVPRIPADTTDAVIALGTDDLLLVATNELGLPGPDPKGPETLAAVKRDMAALVDELHARHIRVFLITTKNYASDPKWTRAPDPQPSDAILAEMQVVADALDDFELGLGVPTFDLRKHPDLLASSNYTDGIHLSPLGLQLFADELSTFLKDNGATR